MFKEFELPFVPGVLSVLVAGMLVVGIMSAWNPTALVRFTDPGIVYSDGEQSQSVVIETGVVDGRLVYHVVQR